MAQVDDAQARMRKSGILDDHRILQVRPTIGDARDLATRIIELRPDGSVVDFNGSYDEYLRSQGLQY